MKNVIKNCLLFLLMAVIVLGCSKNGQLQKEVAGESLQLPYIKRTMESVFFSGELKMEEQITQFSGKGGLARTLIPLAVADSGKCFRYLLTEQGQGKKIRKAYLASRERLSASADLFAIEFKQGSSIYYENGVTNGLHRKAKVRVKLKGQKEGYDLETPAVNLLPACGSGVGPGQPVCIDWYWTLYDVNTGEVYLETYLFTSCEESCAGGGGGGNDMTQCTNECEGEMQSLVNGMLAVSEQGPVQIQNINGIRKYKNPSWRILRNDFGNWSLWSHEEGIVELVDIQDNRWAWVSLKHKSITMKGSPPPGVSVSYTQGTGTPSFVAGTPNILYAGMEVEFQTSVALICKSCPISTLIPPVVSNWRSASIWSAQP